MNAPNGLPIPAGFELFSQPLETHKGNIILARFDPFTSSVPEYSLAAPAVQEALQSMVHGVVLIGPEWRFPADTLGDVAGVSTQKRSATIAVHEDRPRARDILTRIEHGARLYLRCACEIRGGMALHSEQNVLTSYTVTAAEALQLLIARTPSPTGSPIFWK